ncbi:hypothetical protein G3G77_004771 [Salmonella enterica]|nr:hypothetical protein [Salmonella enterica]EEH5466703.1 hypothetical protein [Salmonella enterica]EEH7556023.1 hypothetical protein [Salmonella enterica]EEO5640220.1 hypothetical protein [Salmonella enterica]EEQ0204192.1 hypothetical protein [Salmonella enterica]
MKYISFILLFIGGLISFNTYASSTSSKPLPTPQQCLARPDIFNTTMTHSWSTGSVSDNSLQHYAYYEGCEYVSFVGGSNYLCIVISPDGFFCNWTPTGDVEPLGNGDNTSEPDSKPDDKPVSNEPDSPPADSTSGNQGGNSSTGGSSNGSHDGGSSSSSTPQPDAPSSPFPPNAAIGQLLDSFLQCSNALHSYPPSNDDFPQIDASYNFHAKRCNAIYDQLVATVPFNSLSAPSDDNHKFITKDSNGVIYSCVRNSIKYEDWFYTQSSPYPGEVVGVHMDKVKFRDNTLNFNYSRDNGRGSAVCNSAYESNVPLSSDSSASDSNSSSDSNNPISDDLSNGFCPVGEFHFPWGCSKVDCPSGSHPVSGASLSDSPTCEIDSIDSVPPPFIPESGKGSSDNNDNSDIVGAIERFHADNNKNHHELMDDLNKKPADPDYKGMESQFSSMVGGAMSDITDSFKSAWDAGQTAFSNALSGIDSMIPDIKTSFDLPPAFLAASTGRCIPIVLDFEITLIGVPNYHFHAEATQVCLLFDKYIRPVLDFCLVMLTFFVIHRLLIRSAEFLTDGRN